MWSWLEHAYVLTVKNPFPMPVSPISSLTPDKVSHPVNVPFLHIRAWLITTLAE